MSRLSRFLPRFLRSDKEKRLNHERGAGDSSVCKVLFLDETEFNLPYKGSVKGQTVLDKVFEQLNVFETDFFGLRFIDQTGQTHWLDCQKSLSSQFKGCGLPYTLYFGVKFYPADPCKLREEITRYLFFLQVKRDILHGRLPVTYDEAAELFAYAVQSEIGDFDPNQLGPGYVSEFQFLSNQTEELEDEIAGFHRRLGGVVPATAELKFLDKVKWLDMYGVDLHPVKGESNTEYFLGLTPTGIVVYKNKTKVGNYFWPRITKVNFKGKMFIIKVKDKINDEHIYAFELVTRAACKHLWKCCVEHHAFFRLNQLGEPPPKGSKQFSMGSRHRQSGRQERQKSTDQNSREQPQVMRVQSRRQARRAMSDTRLHAPLEKGITYAGGHITMVVTPEPVKGSRHRSLPDLKGRESPNSTRSAPWETNADTGLYLSGRESPVSVTQSERVQRYHHKSRDSDSESGYRRKYFPNRKGSDNESDVSTTRRRRREIDSGSESDVSPKYKARQRKAKSMGPDAFEQDWRDAMQHVYLPGKENIPNGSIPSLHSAPGGEARQKRLRRRRSKSPNNKRPPEELRPHIEFDLVDPGDLTEEQMREIPFTKIETKAEPFRVKYSPKTRHRYRSPKRKSFGDLDPTVKADEPPPPYSQISDRTPESQHRVLPKPTGYQSDTNSFVSSSQHRPRGREVPPVPPPAQQQFTDSPRSDSKLRSADTSHNQPDSTTYDSTIYPPNNVKLDGKGKPDDNISMISNNLNLNNTNDLPHTHKDTVPDQSNRSTPEVNSDLGSQGQGHELDDDERNRDPGLNSSHGSGTGMGRSPPRNSGRMFGTQNDIARLYSSPQNRHYRSNPRGNQSASQPVSQSMSQTGSVDQSAAVQGPSFQTGPGFSSRQSSPVKYDQYSANSPHVSRYPAAKSSAGYNQTGSQPVYSQNQAVVSQNLPYSQSSPYKHASQNSYSQSATQGMYSQSPVRNEHTNQSSRQNGYGSPKQYSRGQTSQNTFYNQSPPKGGPGTQTVPNLDSVQRNLFYTPPSSQNQSSLPNGSHTDGRTQYQSQNPPSVAAYSQSQGYVPSSYTQQETGGTAGQQYVRKTGQSPSKPYGSPGNRRQHPGNITSSGGQHAPMSAHSSQHPTHQRNTAPVYSGQHPTHQVNTSSAPGNYGQPSNQQRNSGPVYSGQHSSQPHRVAPVYSGQPQSTTTTPVYSGHRPTHQNNTTPVHNSQYPNSSSSLTSPLSTNFRSPDSALGSIGSYRAPGSAGKSSFTQSSYSTSAGVSPTKHLSPPLGTTNSVTARVPTFGRSDIWTEI